MEEKRKPGRPKTREPKEYIELGLRFKTLLYDKNHLYQFRAKIIKLQHIESSFRLIGSGNLKSDVIYNKIRNAVAKETAILLAKGTVVENVLSTLEHIDQLHKEHYPSKDCYIIIQLKK